MSELSISIHNIKGIGHGEINIPIKNGLYAIVGGNGVGKSTIMLCISQLIGKYNLSILKENDYADDSYIEFKVDNRVDKWYCENGYWRSDNHPNLIGFNGTYEGSLFYGSRFKDSKIVDEQLLEGKIKQEHIVAADSYIKEKLGEILHNDILYYPELYRIKNKHIARDLGLQNTPYFIRFNNNNISQYRMSSGECLLISLLHFIYNSIVRKSLPEDQPIIMLIDEIELALHPVAVSNFIKYINNLIADYSNLTVIVTSHSTEVIRSIKPNNMFKLERVKNESNEFNIINPCYPSYAIRDIYQHSGFDNIILVEDFLAKIIVENQLLSNNLTNSRLISVIPAGGWKNVLTLHNELLVNNVLGDKTNIVSILDGDVKDRRAELKPFDYLFKAFLPIPSVEKYLHSILIVDPNNSNGLKIIKELTDKFFRVKSLTQIVSEYKNNQKDKILRKRKNESEKDTSIKYNSSIEMQDIILSDQNGKILYKDFIEDELIKRNINEDRFISVLHELLIKYESDKLNKFGEKLIEIINK